MPIESPDKMVPSLGRYFSSAVNIETRMTVNYPSTPTAHTSVRSPRILSVPILSSTRPVVISHFLRLESEHPATSHESFQSSSSSSSSSEFSASSFFLSFAVSRGTGGPQAMLKMRLFTLSRRRRWVKVSCSNVSNLTEPSSQPRARRVDAGFGQTDQIEPP